MADSIVQIIPAPKHLWLPEQGAKNHETHDGKFGHTLVHYRVAYLALVAHDPDGEQWVEWHNLDGEVLDHDPTFADGPCEERETADRWYCDGHWVDIHRSVQKAEAATSPSVK